jgi:hypothetical protein
MAYSAKEKPSGIGNLFTPTPKSPKSHVRGWTEHWESCLGHNHGDLKILGKSDVGLGNLSHFYFDHGVNATPGQLNLFGGVTDDIAFALMEIAASPHMFLMCLDHSWQDMGYAENLKSRLNQKTCSMFLTEKLIDKIDQQFKDGFTATQYQVDTDTAVIGDSHSIAFADVGNAISRTNGLTLFGALKNDHFENELEKFPDKIERVTLCAGSIDIRHHMLRPSAYPLEDVLFTFRKKVDKLERHYGVQITVCGPVPVEHEGRKIPKTGFYEGEPFFGSQEQRAELTDRWNDMLAERFPRVVTPPQDWFTMDPEEYASTHMELSSSVHIGPQSYRRKGGWHGVS